MCRIGVRRCSGLLLASFLSFSLGCNGSSGRVEPRQRPHSDSTDRPTSPTRKAEEPRKPPKIAEPSPTDSRTAEPPKSRPPPTVEPKPAATLPPEHEPPKKSQDTGTPKLKEPRIATSQPSPTPASGPGDDEQTLPPYLTILQRIEPRGQPRVDANVVMPSKLTLATHNVQRLRIDRRKLPFARGRRVALWIDDQGIELSGPNDLIELVRSRNGDWSSTTPIKVP